MNIYAAVEARLSASPTVTNIVGNPPRIHPGFIPQDQVLPQVCIVDDGGYSVMSHQGASGLGRTRILITSWAATYNSARALDEAIRLRLQGYDGMAGATYIRVPVVSEPIDQSDASTGNEQQRRFGVSREYTLFFKEAKPA